MRHGRGLFLVLISILIFFSACGKKTIEEFSGPSDEELENLHHDSELPIVKNEISLDFFAGKPSHSDVDWNDILVWNEYEEMTNINVNWETAPPESLDDKRMLKLAVGEDLPDAFYAASFPTTDLLKYGEQGLFIPLNDLIDEYAPHLKKILEDHPEIEKAITLPNGKIYSIPTMFDPDFYSIRLGPRPWIDKELLKSFDMEMPETTEDYYEYLKTAKEETNKIPFGSDSIDMLLRWLNGSFGLRNKGFNHPFTDMGPDGELRFIPTSNEYKEMLQYVHQLYKEELFEQNIFEKGTTDEFMANASDGRYASVVSHDPHDLFQIDSMESARALEGPFGDKLYTGISSSVTDIGGFVITQSNENPVATLKWIDHFFSEEGLKFFFMGVEGETYEEVSDGEVQYVDEIVSSSEGLTFEEELAKYLVWPGGGYAGTILQVDYFKGIESTSGSLEAAEKLSPHIIDEVWPDFTYTVEESKVLSSVGVDIEKYVEEMRDQFIVGDIPFSEWDDYLEQLEDMGLAEYMEVKKAALERYQDD